MPEKPTPSWRAIGVGDGYYYTLEVYNGDISEITVICLFDTGGEKHDKRWIAGNYFETEERALFAAERIEALLKKGVNP